MKKKNPDFFRKIKEFEAEDKKDAKFGIKEYLDQEKIKICLKVNEDNIYSKFSQNDKPTINEAVYDYIEKQAYFIPLLKELELDFIFDRQAKLDQVYIKDMLEKHYKLLMLDKKDDLRRNLFKCLLLSILGFAFLAVYFTLSILEKNIIFVEALSIIGTFALWEAADTFILARRGLKQEYLNYAQLRMAEVVFVEDDSQEKE